MLAKLFNSFRIIEDEEFDDFVDVEEEEFSNHDKGVLPFVPNRKSEYSNRNLRNVDESAKPNIIIYKPEKVGDAKDIIDCLLDRNTVAIDLERANGRERQRIMDMVAGYCYCSHCNIEQVNKNIFIVSKGNITIEF